MNAPSPIHVGRFELSLRDVEELRSRYGFASAPSSIAQDFRAGGWREVNRHYLDNQRQFGKRSMRALLERLGVSSVTDTGEALNLIEVALRVFAPEGGYQGITVRRNSNELWMVNRYCPVFAALEENNWRGVTACPSWYIRRGWLDALNVEATDSVIQEKKWGAGACTAAIRIEACGRAVV